MKVAPLFRSLLLSSVSMVFVDIGYADDTGGQYVVGADNTDSTVQDAVNGPVSLVKDGSGTVTVTGTNTYSGSTSVNNGTLIFNVGQQYVLTSSVTVSSYTDNYPKMVVDNSWFSSNGNVAIGIAQGSSGELSIQGANSNFQNQQAWFVVGNGDPNYGTGSSTKTSVLRIADGAQALAYGVVVGNYGNTSGEVDVVGQGSTLTAGSYNLYVNGDGQGTVNVRDGGQISNNGQVIFGSGTGTGFATLNVGPNGTLVAGDVSPSKPGIVSSLPSSQYQVLVNNGTIQNYQGFSLHSAVNMTLNGTLYANTLDQQTEFSGVLSGKGGVDKQGTGSLTLSGNNSFQGGTTVEGGNLLITGKNQYTGDTVVQYGSIQIGNGGNTGSIDNSSNIILQNINASVVFNRSDSLTATQKITGAGGLTQQGPGSLRLTGNNDYKGETWVKGGTLIVNGDQSAATGDTQVTNSGILAGTGTLGGDGIIKAGGRLAPGDGEYIGALNIKKNLSFDPNAHQTWLVGRDSKDSAASSNFINVGGNLSLAGAVDVIATPQGRNMKPDGSLQDGIYRTYNYDGTLSIDPSFRLATAQGVNINTIAVQTSVPHQVNLISNPQHLSFWDVINGDVAPNGTIHGGSGFWAAPNAPGGGGGTLSSGLYDAANNNWTDINADRNVHTSWKTGNYAVFEGEAGTVNIQSNQKAPILVDGMQFANTDGGVYTLNGDPIYASSNMLTIRVGDGSSVSGSIKALINSSLDDSMVSGGASLTKLDPGTLILGANNNYQGQTFINGGTLQLGNGGETGSVGAGEIVNKGTLAVNHSNDITLGQTISGSGDVWQNGSGTTTLMGNNSYTGATHITNGTLALAVSGSISSSAGVRVDGDTAKFDLSSLSNRGTSIQTLSGQGNVVLGANNLTITNGNRTVNTVFRDDGETINVTSNTYSGEGNDNTVYIDSNGKVIPKSQYNADNGDRIVDLNKDGSIIVGNRFNGSISGLGGVNITGGQEIFSGQNTFSGRMSVSSGAGLILTGSLRGGEIDPNQGGLYNQGTVTVKGGTVFGKSINDNANAVLTGVNHSTFGDIENNSGKLILSQSTANSLSNNSSALIDGSTINGALASGSNGVFEVTSNNATVGSLTGAGAGKIDGNLTVENAQEGTYSGTMDGAGSFTVNNGKQILTGDSNYTGLTTIGKNAIVQYGDGGTTGRIKGIFPNTNSQIRDDGQLIINHSNLVQGTSGIFGSGSLYQVGAGTTVLSGNNSYTGGTTVTNGTLQVDGDQSPASGDTIVQSGGNLAGSGILGGNVYLQKGATLSPGDAPKTIGAFTIQGNLTEENGSQQKWDIGQIGTAGGAYNDYVDAKGDLTLGGQLVVNANLNGPSVHNGVLEPGVYRLYSYGGKLSGDVAIDKGNLSIPDGYTGDYLTLQKLSVPNQVNIVADAKNLNFWDGGDPAHHGKNPVIGNGTVDGGDGEWIARTGNNWTSVSGYSNTGWLLGGRAIFTNKPGTVTVKDYNSAGAFDPVTTVGMQFIGGDAQNHYKIVGDDLFVTSKNTTIRVGDGTIASKNMFAEIGSAINDSQVAGGGAVTKSDLGTLILAADNTYRGGTTIDAGTLQLGNGGSSGWVGSGDITNNGVLAVNRSNDVNFTQKISGSGSFVQMGGNDSHTTLSAQEGYTGSTTVLNGTLALAGEGSIAQSSGVMSSATGHFDIAGISASGTSVTTLGGNGGVDLGDKNLTLANANRTIRVQLLDSQNVNRSVDISDNSYTGPNGNHLIYTDADGNEIASNAYDPNKGDLVFDLSKNGQVITDNQYGGAISGKGGLTIARGTEVLSGANTYTGMTSVTGNASLLLPGSLQGDVTNAGVVDVNGGGIAGTTTNNGSNAVLTAENNASLGNILNNDGRATLVNASAQNVTNSPKGTFSAAGGQLESLTNAGTASLISGNNVKQNVTNTGKLTLDGDTIGGTLYSNGGTFTVTNNTASVGSLAGSASGTLNGQLTLTNAHDTYSGVLSGDNQQVNIKSGEQVFSGQNSYTGDTLIGSDGTLQLGNGGEAGSVASGTIRDEGNLVINRSNDYFLSQALLGGGNVKQIGAGRTIITSPNAYTGFTSIEHGRLALQEGGSVLRSSGVHVRNDGVFDISEIKEQDTSSGGKHGGVSIPGGTSNVQTGNDGKTAIVQALDGNGNVFLGDKNLQISNANTAFGNKYSGIVSGKGEVTLTGGQEVFEGTNTSSGITSVAIPATLTLKGSLQHDAKNAGKLDVDGGSIAGQTVNNGSSALLTAENNASFSDIVNTQGRVALTNATAGTVTNAAGQTFGASGGKLARVTNSGTATLGKQNVVTGDVTNTAKLILDGNTVNGTLHADGGSFAVTNNNAQIGSLVGTANGTLTGELTIANAHDTYDGVMSGTGGVNVSRGKEIFSANQHYLGDTTIGKDATLQLGLGGTTGGVAGTAIHDDGTLKINRSNRYDLSQVVSGAGDLVQAGTGRTVVNTSQAYSGATTVENGALALNDNGSIESSSGVHVLNNSVFDISGGQTAQPFSLFRLSLFAVDDAAQTSNTGQTKTIQALDGSGNISLGNNTLQISNANEKFGNLYTGVISGNGGVNITGGKETFTGQQTYAGTTAVSPNAELTLFNGSLQGDVYNKGTVTVDGGQVAGQSMNDDANAVLTGRNNAQFGDINNKAGQVLLHQSTANSLTSQGYVLLDGATVTGAADTGNGTLDVSAQNAKVGSLTGAAGQGTLSGLLTIQQGQGAYGGALKGTGGLTVSGGTQVMTGDSTYSGITTINPSAVVQYGDGGTSGRATGSAIVNNGQLIINHSDRVDMTSMISGSGRFDQVGSGVTALSGNNSYTGDTTVEHGTLQVDGDQSKATGATTVQSGATLAGRGTLGGNTTVQSGATLSPGDVSGAVGGLTVKGNLVTEAGSQQKWTFGQVGIAGGSYNDYVNVQGNLSLGGTLEVNAKAGPSVHDGTLDAGVYRLYGYGGTLYGADGKPFTKNDLTLDTGNLATPNGYRGDYLMVQTEIAHQVNLVVNAQGLNFWDGGNAANHGTDLALGNGQVDGGDGEWFAGNGSNWTGPHGTSNVGWLADGRAVFGAQTGTVTVKDSAADGSFNPVKMTGMQFISGDSQNYYKITGDDLYAASNNTVMNVGDGNNSADSARIVAELNSAINDSQIQGGTALTKTGVGTLIVSSDNHYQGPTTIESGTLQLGNGGTTGSVGPADIINDGTLAVNRTNDLTLDQHISGTGGLIQQGSGSTTLTNDNSYSGVTELTNGTLNLRGKGAIAQSAGVQSTGNARFDISGIDAAGTSVQTLWGQGQVNLGDKSLTLSNANHTVDQNGQVLTDNQYGGVISGQGGLTLANRGMEILSGNNQYAGETGIDKGTVLQIGAGGTTGSAGRGAIRDDGTFVVNRSNEYVLPQNLYGSGDFAQVGTGRTSIEGPGTYTGTTTITHGTLALAQNGGIQKSVGVHVGSDGTFDISALGTGATAVQALDGSGNVALGSKTLQLSNANTQFGNVYSGVMSGTGGSFGITVGHEVLTGANTYTGTTSVASGAGLTLTGSLQSAVSNAGTFDVNGGRIAGQTVNDGSNALMTVENNAHLSDIVNKQGVVNLVNSYAQNVTNRHGATFSATSGQLAGLTNAGDATLTAHNTVTGDAANTGNLTLDGDVIAGTLSAQDGLVTVTNNNVAVGSLAGNGKGLLNGQLAITNGHDTFGGDLSGGGTVQIEGGKQTFSGANDYTGATTITHGTLALAQNGGIQKSVGVHVGSDGTFDISALGTGATAVQALDGSGNVALGSKTLQLSNANTQFGNVYSGVMSGTGGSFGITVGHEVLTGANTYTGTTSVASGAGLTLTGSLQSAVSNAGTFDVNGGRVAGQTVNDESSALITAENNAHLSDIVNKQGVVNLVNSYAQNVTNRHGATFSATSGQLAGLTNAGDATLTAHNTVTGDAANTGNLTLDGDVIAGTLSAQDGLVTVTNNNVAVGSLAGNGKGLLNGQLAITNGHDTFGGDLSGGGTVQIEGGKQTFSGANDYTGATTITHGTLALAQNGGIQKSVGVHVGSDGTFDISALGTGATAVQALDGSGNVALGSKTLQLSNANTQFGNVYSGVMSGTGGSFGITVGHEVLTGANTYTGTTSVASGAGLTLTGSLQSAVSNAGTFDVNGGRIAGQTVNDGSNALMTAENNAHLSDIVNKQGVVNLVNSYAQNVTNRHGATFSATSGQLAGLTNAGDATLTAHNTVTGDAANTGNLTLDGDVIAGTLSAQDGLVTVTNNNVAVGSLAGNGKGLLNGQLAITNGHDTFGGDLSGGGTVQIEGGKQTFSGANDYTGATTITHGTLALAQNGGIQKSAGVHVGSDGTFDISALGTGATAVQALDGSGNVALGSKTLQLSNANTQFGNVYSGVMSGDGSFNLTGGREVLTGDSTYRGTTKIDQGAHLVLGNNSTTGSVQGSTIDVDGDLTINRSNRAVFNQTITGSGSLIQDGDGVTQLNGMSSYSGPTIVQRGGLDVEGALSGSDVQVNAGTLSGTGMAKSVTMERGSIFAPAGDGQIGTFSVGNGQNNALVMKDGSTLSIDVKGSSSLSAAELNDELSTLTFQKRLYQVLPSDQIHVTGSAQIGNNVELSLPRGGTIKPGEAFTLVTSTNGVNGSFSGISGLNALSAFVKPEFIHSDDNKDLTLLLERNSLAFGDIGGTRNERATGTALDHVSVEKNVVQAMLSLNERDARQATNSLSGELHASARTALIQDSYYIRQAALDRLDSADCDGSSGNGIGTADLRTGQKTHQCLSDRPVLWGESYGSLGSNSGDGNATSLHHSAAGFVMGADAPVVAQWRVGGMVGYGHSMFNQKSGSSGSGHSDNITIGAYAGRNLGNISFKMGASYTWNLLSTRRTASVGSSYSSRLTSGYTGGTAQAFGEVGYKIHLNRTIIEPFANVAYVNQNTDSYHEHGGDAALRGRSMDTGVTFSTFGVRASSSFMIGKTQLTPHATVAYRRAYGVTTPTARELFASSSSSTMDIAGVPLSKDSAVVDTGITARLTDRINVDVSYIGQYGNQSVDSGARANINVQF